MQMLSLNVKWTKIIMWSRQKDGTNTVKVEGYGNCKNCTVVVYAESPTGATETKTVKIVNGSGECTLSSGDKRMKKVSNIVCN